MKKFKYIYLVFFDAFTKNNSISGSGNICIPTSDKIETLTAYNDLKDEVIKCASESNKEIGKIIITGWKELLNE